MRGADKEQLTLALFSILATDFSVFMLFFYSNLSSMRAFLKNQDIFTEEKNQQWLDFCSEGMLTYECLLEDEL